MQEYLRALRNGEVVAYPTETFYGLAVDASNESALKRLNEIKGERQLKPYPILVPSLEFLQSIAEVGQFAQQLIAEFWPGALTLVLKARHPILPVTASDGTVAVRMSSQPLAQTLASQFKGAITCTSANPTGKVPATHAAMVRDYFSDRVRILDGGVTTGKLPSTIVRLHPSVRIERQGEIPAAKIERWIGPFA